MAENYKAVFRKFDEYFLQKKKFIHAPESAESQIEDEMLHQSLGENCEFGAITIKADCVVASLRKNLQVNTPREITLDCQPARTYCARVSGDHCLFFHILVYIHNSERETSTAANRYTTRKQSNVCLPFSISFMLIFYIPPGSRLNYIRPGKLYMK